MRYRHKVTGQINVYGNTIPRLDASDQWERMTDDAPAPPVLTQIEDAPTDVEGDVEVDEPAEDDDES